MKKNKNIYQDYGSLVAGQKQEQEKNQKETQNSESDSDSGGFRNCSSHHSNDYVISNAIEHDCDLAVESESQRFIPQGNDGIATTNAHINAHIDECGSFSFSSSSSASSADDVLLGGVPDIAGKLLRYLSPVPTVVLKALVLVLVAVVVVYRPQASVAGSSTTTTTIALVPTTTTVTASIATATIPPAPLPSNSNSNDSPFFDHVLEWRKGPRPVELEDIPLGLGHNYNTSDATGNGSSNINSHDHGDHNHYRASLEFCSDPEKDLYGYGPVGSCVPGKAAPLIRMQPKRFYHLTLFNNAHIDTNLHTHGLHVSGVGTVDDVTRVAKPGECLTYDYYILDDADVGTFWYHPHRHPLVTVSAFGGAYGMLIVDETVAVQDKDPRSYPEHLVNFLTRNEVLLQFSSMYNKKLKHPVRSNAVNGHDGLDLVLSPETHYYFRVSSVVYAESINFVEFDPPDACDVRVVAYDGVYRSEVPGPLALHKHMMTVSSRADFAVSCAKDADVHFHQGTKSDRSKLVRIRLATPSGEESKSKSKLVPSSNGPSVSMPATLPSSPYWDTTAETSWKPRRPYYMPDLSANPADEFWKVSMDDYYVNGTKGASVNQHVWDPHTSIRTFSLGQLIEYPILLSQTHPYHSHINRMQIVQPGGCGNRFEEGEYFDTIVQSEDTPECKIRTKFFDFAGRVVIHCHRWNHEDQGMMTWIDVLGGEGHGIEAGPATSCAAVL